MHIIIKKKDIGNPLAPEAHGSQKSCFSTKLDANISLLIHWSQINSTLTTAIISVDENDLETLSHDVKMNYSDYTAQTRKALTRVNLGSLNFVYQTKKQKDGSLLLSWKKHMMAENIKVSSYTNGIDCKEFG